MNNLITVIMFNFHLIIHFTLLHFKFIVNSILSFVNLNFIIPLIFPHFKLNFIIHLFITILEFLHFIKSPHYLQVFQLFDFHLFSQSIHLISK